MLPTAGFIPPPVVPLVPAAANAIVPTGGALVGVAAAAATGAKYGAALGPKGLLAGALVGAAVGALLLLPAPLAPGTIPSLDPGLNDPNADQDRLSTVTVTNAIDPVTGQYPETSFAGRWVREEGRTRHCGGAWENNPRTRSQSVWQTDIFAETVTLTTAVARWTLVCSPSDPAPSASIVEVVADGEVVYGLSYPNGSGYYDNEKSVEGPHVSYVEGARLTVDNKDYLPQPTREPRQSPVPLPKISPRPAPQPSPRPLPEPDPVPEPLRVPNPDDPDAPPVTIPKAPPAPPQPVPTPKPTPTPRTVPAPDPEPDPLTPEPDPDPFVPRPVHPPLPVPGVPTVPEPTPDPNIFPAPGPSPLPLPVPRPNPSPDPGTTPGPNPVPQPVPTPITPGTPGPGPITTPITPEDPTAVDPETGLVPQPDPQPVPTPPGSHFPVSGGPAVTPGGARSDLSAIAAEVGRIEQKTARLQNGQGGPDLSDWLWLLPLLQDFFEGDIPGTTYDLQGVCESVAPDQEQPIARFPVEPAKNLGAIINRLDVMQDIFQQHLAWRTPTCTGELQQGDWRTISFISDELSPGGKRRLDKRLRYRSQSSIGLAGVVEHWAGFTWSAGPVIVKHTGAWWGSPRVWAATVDEGKRVLRHAAGEAGLDPDQAGRWEISGISDPRRGAPGTMRVNTKGGYYWITARDGSDERPIVSKT